MYDDLESSPRRCFCCSGDDRRVGDRRSSGITCAVGTLQRDLTADNYTLVASLAPREIRQESDDAGPRGVDQRLHRLGGCDAPRGVSCWTTPVDVDRRGVGCRFGGVRLSALAEANAAAPRPLVVCAVDRSQIRGLRRVHGPALPFAPQQVVAKSPPPTQLYFYTDELTAARRDWGDEAAYFADPEGNILVIARPLASQKSRTARAGIIAG